MVGAHMIKAWSATQASIALSSGEAEYYGVVRGAGIGLGVQALYRDLGLELPIRVWTDSSAAIGIGGRQGLGKLRHLECHSLWVQQRLRRGEFKLLKVPGEANPADLFTKHLESRAKVDQLVSLFNCRFLEGRAASAPALRQDPGSVNVAFDASLLPHLHPPGDLKALFPEAVAEPVRFDEPDCDPVDELGDPMPTILAERQAIAEARRAPTSTAKLPRAGRRAAKDVAAFAGVIEDAAPPPDADAAVDIAILGADENGNYSTAVRGRYIDYKYVEAELPICELESGDADLPSWALKRSEALRASTPPGELRYRPVAATLHADDLFTEKSSALDFKFHLQADDRSTVTSSAIRAEDHLGFHDFASRRVDNGPPVAHDVSALRHDGPSLLAQHHQGGILSSAQGRSRFDRSGRILRSRPGQSGSRPGGVFVLCRFGSDIIA